VFLDLFTEKTPVNFSLFRSKHSKPIFIKHTHEDYHLLKMLLQKDVNSRKKRYEGKHSYAVYSHDDGIVGQNCCGQKCSEIRNANLTVTKRGYDHVSIMSLTKELQYSLLKYKISNGL
jgi:hypothetical protein